jgi:hypothetical protein
MLDYLMEEDFVSVMQLSISEQDNRSTNNFAGWLSDSAATWKGKHITHDDNALRLPKAYPWRSFLILRKPLTTHHPIYEATLVICINCRSEMKTCGTLNPDSTASTFLRESMYLSSNLYTRLLRQSASSIMCMHRTR